MDSESKDGPRGGLLFISATAASLLGTALELALTGTDYLTRISENMARVSGGGLLGHRRRHERRHRHLALSSLAEMERTLGLAQSFSGPSNPCMYTLGAVSMLSLPTRSLSSSRSSGRRSLVVAGTGDSLVGV